MLAHLGLLPMRCVPDTVMPSVLDPSGHTDPGSLVHHTAFENVLHDGRRFKDSYGMTVAEFVILHARLSPGILGVRHHSSGGGIDHAHSHTRLTSAEQLLVWLEYIKGARNATQRLYSGGIDRTTVDRYVDHVTRAINYMWEHLVEWPDASVRADLQDSFGVAAGVIGVLDGTHCQISRPTHNARLYCAGQKKIYSQNYLVAVNVLGVVMYIAGPYPGSVNDRTAWRECALYAERESLFAADQCLLADGGFVGGRHLLCPYHVFDIRAAPTEEHRQLMIQFNNEISRDRTLVEDAFAWIKQAAPILGMRYKRHHTRQSEALFAVCRWWNALRMLRAEYAIGQQ